MRQITITEDDGVMTLTPSGDITWMEIVAFLEWGKYQVYEAWGKKQRAWEEESVLADGSADELGLG